MVKAILEGIKTQTRRTKGLNQLNENQKRYHIDSVIDGVLFVEDLETLESFSINCPFGKVGDILWVKETSCWVLLEHAHDLLEDPINDSQIVYKSNVHPDWMEYAKEKYGYKWKPSIFMPKNAARIFLEITNIRIERLANISEEDAVAEGCFQYEKETDWLTAKYGFELLWKSINGIESFDSNPFVWVIEFKIIEK